VGIRKSPHLCAAVLAALCLLAFAAPAGAVDYCLNAPGCSGTNVATVKAAFDAAGGNATADTLTIGPSATPYDANFETYTSAQPFDIRGAGAGKTVLKSPVAAGGNVLRLGGGATIADVDIDGTGVQQALGLDSVDARRVRIVGTPELGVDVANGSSFVDGSVTASNVGIGGGPSGSPSMIARTTIVAERGVHCGAACTLDRLRIEAATGIEMSASGETATVTDSAVIGSTTGVRLWRGTLNLTRVTVAGGPGSTGVSVDPQGGDATLNLSDSLVSTLGTDIKQIGTGVAVARNSGFTTWTGGVTVFDAHFVGDPGFADRAAGDLRLRADSPLIDRGGTTVPAGALDAAGAPRVVDSDGDGTATVDIGAYERPAPAPPPPVDNPGPPPGDPAPPPAGNPGQPAPDLTRPSIGLSFPRQRLGKLSSKGLAVKLDASEPAALSLELSVDKKTAAALKLGRRAVVVGKLSVRVGAGPRTVRVKLTSKARKALNRARKVKLTLAGSARDDAGNTGPIKGSLTLKR
jgi:hypothetical protein